MATNLEHIFDLIHSDFLYAVRDGDLNQVKKLISDRSVDVHSTSEGTLALMAALVYGHEEIILYLWKHGACLVASLQAAERSPRVFHMLQWACVSGHERGVKATLALAMLYVQETLGDDYRNYVPRSAHSQHQLEQNMVCPASAATPTTTAPEQQGGRCDAHKKRYSMSLHAWDRRYFADKFGQCLYNAAKYNRLGVVQMLLRNPYVNVDYQCVGTYRTPLHAALIGYSLDDEDYDSDGATPPPTFRTHYVGRTAISTKTCAVKSTDDAKALLQALVGARSHCDLPDASGATVRQLLANGAAAADCVIPSTWPDEIGICRVDPLQCLVAARISKLPFSYTEKIPARMQDLVEKHKVRTKKPQRAKRRHAGNTQYYR